MALRLGSYTKRLFNQELYLHRNEAVSYIIQICYTRFIFSVMVMIHKLEGGGGGGTPL